MNLRSVERAPFERATLGYRVGERHSGYGYASEAVRLALVEAFGPLGLCRVEAVVTAEHAASQGVLRRNGFRAYGRSTRSVRPHQTWHDLLHYERHRDGAL
ncbi:MAG: GNAT family N-acetyltransferase [Bacteroidota bacterium]